MASNVAHVCLLVSLAAAGATPAIAAPDSHALAFAYPSRHPVTPLSSAAIARMVSTDGEDSDVADAFDEPHDTPIDIHIGAPRKLSQDGMCHAVVSVARAYDLPIVFFANLIWQESNFDVGSISRAGALGVAQFMPQTASEFSLPNPFEPIHALYASARFLSQLNTQFGNLGLAAMAYNAGPRRVTDWIAKRGALPGETRNYVVRITGNAAEKWTSTDFTHGPEAALMPAKAPCTAVAQAAAEQAKVVKVARLMTELADAAKPPPPPPKVDPKIASDDTVIDTDYALSVVRLILKHRRDHKTRVAAADDKAKPATKSVKRAWERIADRTMRKAADAFAKLSVSERHLAAR
jgi:hypothetical protein